MSERELREFEERVLAVPGAEERVAEIARELAAQQEPRAEPSLPPTFARLIMDAAEPSPSPKEPASFPSPVDLEAIEQHVQDGWTASRRDVLDLARECRKLRAENEHMEGWYQYTPEYEAAFGPRPSRAERAEARVAVLREALERLRDAGFCARCDSGEIARRALSQDSEKEGTDG